MPTTYYHTINGKILSEQTGGVRTEYMHDALGSVTGTTDGSANLQNRYWWAPYGTQIAKTGTEADPGFGWVGTLGYRAVDGTHAGFYMRSRHFGIEQASWTSLDRKPWVDESYRYAFGRPAIVTDPAGALGCIVKEGPTFGSTCGGAVLGIDFLLGPAEQKGWVIQHVVIEDSLQCCNSATGSDLPFEYCAHFTESGHRFQK